MSRIKKSLLILLCIPPLVLFSINLYRNQSYVHSGTTMTRQSSGYPSS